MKKSYVQINGVLYERGHEPVDTSTPMIIDDIAPYQSMIDGSLITSRSQHREHLRANGCVEIGDQVEAQVKQHEQASSRDIAPQQRHEVIRAQIDAMSDRDFRRALRRDIERVKWNSRTH
jgi:hypothetical protein